MILIKQLYDQKELLGLFFGAAGGAVTIASNQPVSGMLMILYAIATNPQVIEHMEQSALDDPYWRHMPRDVPEAVLYSASIGGESHDISECTII